MQLKNQNISTQLLTASCTLLASHGHSKEWDIDTAIMYYGETDRVTAIEGVVQGTRSYESGVVLSSKLVFDSLTGASATGAVPQSQRDTQTFTRSSANGVQTFTRPSGNGVYEVPAGETPLDDTFKDTRIQLSAQWSQASSNVFNYSAGLQGSREYDYQSIVGNGSIGKFLYNKNTELSIGTAIAFDKIKPVGRAPIPLSVQVLPGNFFDESAFRDAFNATRGKDTDTKITVDLKIGVTQIINRRWITQFNVGFSDVDGYQTDPYKLVSLVDDLGDVIENLYESRPDKRSKHSFFAQSKAHFRSTILDTSYRFAHDDWGISSHTLETRIHFLLSDHSTLTPHVRYYQQSEADFYTPFFVESVLSTHRGPDFASADYRIGRLNAMTLGGKYSHQMKNGRRFAARLEYYTQTPKDIGKTAPGQLADADLYPRVSALIFQLSYAF